MGSARRLGLPVAALVWSLGCGSAPEAQAPKADDGPTTGAPSRSSASSSTRHLGEWVMAPPPGQEREVALVRHALATPPAVDAFEAMGPAPDEREFFDGILRTRRERPDAPVLESLQRKLDQLEGVRLTFLPDRFFVTTASGTTAGRYRVEEDLGERLIILEEGHAPEEKRRKIISFDGDDRIVLTTGGTRVPMVRVPAGTPPAPNEVPSSGATSLGASTPPPGGAEVPASGDPGFDACVAEYYACIERMPTAEREAMAPAIDATRKVFTAAQKDPAQKQSAYESCKQAVALGRATFCR